MVSSFSPPRVAVLLLLPLAGCSFDRLMPPAEIGAAPTPDRKIIADQRLVGRVDGGRDLLGKVDDPALATSASVPDPLVGSPYDPLADSPPQDTASTNLAAPIDGERRADDPAGDYSVPSEGVSMDAELGVGGLAQADATITSDPSTASQQVATPPITGPVTIAEGATDQPVVDGIGTDNPVPMLAAPDEEIVVPDPAITGGVKRR